MYVRTGLDRLIGEEFEPFRGQRVILLTNQAAVSRNYTHSLDALLDFGIQVVAVFGPQHGVWGYTQDNMIEWESYTDARTGIPFYSLYGETRVPRDEWFTGADRLVVDLVDVGTRVYTFIWTMAHCLAVAERLGVPVTVLDRPNPITSREEGPNLEPGFQSFVGLFDVPLRHGRTVGEIALWLQKKEYPKLDLEVVWCEGWRGDMPFSETGLPWVPPSPNMPLESTAFVYPGSVLFEGTNLSEGRGTTRPFETIGAPWLNPWAFADELNERSLPGVFFRPVTFQPTNQKHAGQLCGGVFIHMVDPSIAAPIVTAVHILDVAVRQGGEEFHFLPPPYEYEMSRMPIDLLWGSSGLRIGLLERSDVKSLLDSFVGPHRLIPKHQTYI
ncbi:MAG: DUF1343 domain-containing protein [Fimbriimonadaceae bacterium]|nr:DUF1343 domain-containing protein [Fimbriimonadaceae bacterium]